MRAYKFLNEKFGLMALLEKRLKISRIMDLNDPFELTPYNLTDTRHRHAFLLTRNQLAEETGMMCFSSSWCDPVIWAHYSDKHKGLCLGFEIPDNQVDIDDDSGYVNYIAEPLPFPPDFLSFDETNRLAIVRRILFTKFKHWEYEHEIRLWTTLKDEEDGLHFIEFGEKLKIVEVILGARCTLSRSQITQALGAQADEVKITRARAAYDKFAMVEDEGLE